MSLGGLGTLFTVQCPPASPSACQSIDRRRLYLATRCNAVLSGAGQIWTQCGQRQRTTPPQLLEQVAAHCSCRLGTN